MAYYKPARLIMTQPVVFEKAEFWYDQGILFIKFLNKDRRHAMTLDSMKDYVDTIIKLCNGRPSPFLIDMSEAVGNYSIASARYYGRNEALSRVHLGDAFVANGITAKLTIRSFKRIFDSKAPYRIFSNKEEAINHCMGVIEQKEISPALTN